ncbi:hypothetical protein [Flexivirga caeni]|uniref:Uncharacterized protein n=1 Tax=Flexivirga caeni TaxID=2294115 RepID=A0A3M9MHZ7_9MICO|nr:hypothetical protein [Flexivirga caeni]RNI25124.1 hypothetical protein EFY87_00250 [Flexivirga caeni]
MSLPRRRGLALTIVGAVLMLILAPAAAGIGIWQGVSHGMSAVNDQPWHAASSSVHVDTTDSQTILVDGTYDDSQALPACRITGPDGQQVAVSQGDGRLTIDWGSTALTRVGTFQPTTAGDYTIDCSGLRTKVLDSDIAGDIAHRVLVPIGIGVGGGALVFLVGVVLLIIGIVKLVNSGKERNRARLAAAGYPGAPGTYPGPYGAGPPPHSGPAPGGQPPYGPTPGDPKDPYGR